MTAPDIRRRRVRAGDAAGLAALAAGSATFSPPVEPSARHGHGVMGSNAPRIVDFEGMPPLEGVAIVHRSRRGLPEAAQAART